MYGIAVIWLSPVGSFLAKHLDKSIIQEALASCGCCGICVENVLKMC